MERRWQLQEAKNRFSAVVNEALSGDPQIITRHGEEVVVVLSLKEYRQLVSPEDTLCQFFADSPLVGIDLDLERDPAPPREPIDL
jgi:antitoxin Phd